MMLLMAAGVKKSLVFNNVLNAINLAVWVFIMTAGMYYVDTDNWNEHDGFFPYDWSGVSIFKCIYNGVSFKRAQLNTCGVRDCMKKLPRTKSNYYKEYM